MNLRRNKLEYICLKPDEPVIDIVESIWMVKNHSDEEKEAIIVPDGKIDLFLLADENGNFEIFISGICSAPVTKPPFPKSTMFAISFYPIAAENIFKKSFADLNNTKKTLPSDYWGFSRDDLNDFNQFYHKAIKIISLLLSKEVHDRKKKLFKLIHASKGEITVKELEENIFWISRQMNRYFHKWLGLTLKSYLNIIRFSNSLKQLKNGDFYPNSIMQTNHIL